jgi:hypothetical protein
VFFPVVVVIYCLWLVRPAEWKRLVPPVVATCLATLMLSPLLWGYHVRLSKYGLVRGMEEIRAFSADVVGLAGMFHANTAWQSLLPHDFEERALFPGFTILALALIALLGRSQGSTAGEGTGDLGVAGTPRGTVWSRRLLMASAVVTVVVLASVWTGPWGWHFGPVPLPPFDPHRVFSVAFVLLLAALVSSRWFRDGWARRDLVVFFAVALLALWLLALGPSPEWSTPWRAITYGPYWLFMQMPGAEAIRVPARIWLAGVLCLAMLAGCGAAVLLQRYVRRPALAVAALSLLIVVEGWFRGGTVEAPRPVPAGAIPEHAVVLDLPLVLGYQNAVPQYRAVIGGYRTINGYSGYEPPFFEPFLKALDERRADALNAYLKTGDLYLIIRPDVDPALVSWLTSVPGATEVSAAGEAHIYRLPRF